MSILLLVATFVVGITIDLIIESRKVRAMDSEREAVQSETVGSEDQVIVTT